jgi:hypothetical protein
MGTETPHYPQPLVFKTSANAFIHLVLVIARQTIHLSLHLPKDMQGEGFNVADAKEYESWETKWPQLCSYFGLKGTDPPQNSKDTLEMREYINDHIDSWKKLEDEHNLKKGVAYSDLTFPGFEVRLALHIVHCRLLISLQYFLMTQFDFDRQYDMNKMYSTPIDNPFREERSTMEAWGVVFDRMRGGKLLPQNAKAN